MKCFLAILLLVFAYALQAQPALKIDSLQQQLRSAPAQSTEKAKVLLDISAFYRSTDPVESIAYAEKLLELAQRMDSKEYIYLGHMATGAGYAIEGSSIEKALEHFLAGSEIADRQPGQEWQLRQIKAMMNVAGVHYTNDDIPQALSYSYEYVRQLEEVKDTATLAASYETLALMHKTAQTWDSVYYYINKAKTLYEITGQKHRLLEVKLIEGQALKSNGNYSAALDVFTQLHDEAAIQKDTVTLMNLYPSLSDMYLLLDQVDSAKYYALTGLNMISGRSLTSQEAAYYIALSDIFSTTEQYDSALYYFKAYAEAKEKKLNTEKVNAVQEMEARYQVKQRMQENNRLKATIEAEKARNVLLLTSSTLFLVLIIAIVLFYARLRKRKIELERLNQEVFQINSQLLSLINEKKHMVSLIAHDIRNPLSLIQLNTHALADDSASFTAAERDEMLNEIEAATNAIDHASVKIMEIENKSEQQIPIQTDNFDVTPPLLNAQKEFLAYAKSKNIKLRFELSNKKYFIQGDPFLFRHIVSNFVSNALKYSPHGTEVKVALEEVKDKVAIKVIDQGPGLAEDDQQKIFQKGTTANSKPTAGERQLGEGLYLTKRYIEAMNGQVEVQSQLGKGTIFTLFFPKAA